MADGNHTIDVDVEQHKSRDVQLEVQLGKRIIQFFLAVAAILIGMFVASMPVFDEIKLHHKILWPIWGVSSIITFLAAFLLLSLLMCANHFHHRLLTWLIFLTGLALTASYCSLLFLVKVNATIAIIIPAQKLIVVGVIAYMGTRTQIAGAHDEVGTRTQIAGAHDETPDDEVGTRTQIAGAHDDTPYDEAYESEMDCSFDLSKLSNAAAFTVQTALIISYLKSSSNSSEAPAASPCELMNTSRADLAITCFGSTLCLCSMMITCMPLRFSIKEAKGCLLATVKILKYAMLVALAWIATTLAAGLLDEMVPLSFAPLLVASAFFVFWEFRTGEEGTTRPTGEEVGDLMRGEPEAQSANRAKEYLVECKNIFIGTMAVAYYTILVFVYSKDPGRETDKLYLKLFVLLILAAIISGLAMTPFAMKPKRSPSQSSGGSPSQSSGGSSQPGPPQSSGGNSQPGPPQSSGGNSQPGPPQSSGGSPSQSSGGSSQPGYENSLAVARIMVSFAGLLVLIVFVMVVYVCIKLY